MILFFRRIRKSLLSSGAISKYLIYALGEILLVMVGILLALQVNNWNEWRKDRQEERVLLEDLSVAMELNISRFDGRIRAMRRNNESFELIRSFMRKELSYHDSLDFHFQRAFVNGARFPLTEVSYLPLRNSGGKIISNTNLKKEIMHLYEVTYLFMKEELKIGINDDPELHPFLDEHFKRRITEQGMQPHDISKIIDNKILTSLLNKAAQQRGYFEYLLSPARSETERVLKLIKDELGEEL